MKQLMIIGLILLFSVSVWAQQTNGNTKAPEKTQKAMRQDAQSAPGSASQQNTVNTEKKDQENVIDYDISRQSPQKVRGKVVKNTASGDKKERDKSGSASTSGEKQTLEKKNVKSKNTTSDLKKALKTVKKVEPKKNTEQE